MILTNETLDILRAFAKENKISNAKLQSVAQKILEPVSEYRAKEYTNAQKIQMVFDVIGDDSFSYQDINECSDIPKHAVAYRINKMKKQRKIIEVGNILKKGKGGNPKLFQIVE